MKLRDIDRASLGMVLMLALAGILSLVVLCSGCKNQNTGSAIKVGDITSLPEISDASDNITMKVLLMMTGASIWTAKDSLVKVGYVNCYTNWYCGIIERRGMQNLTVEVEPLSVEGANAATEEASEGAEDGKQDTP